MRGPVVVIALSILAGCVHDDLVQCGDGRACPVGTICDEAHAGCATLEQLTACAGVNDGELCTSSLVGICDQGVCLPGCGDGAQSTNEQCDDGNFASHDGCSSRCELETLQWSPWNDPEPWTPRGGHVAAFDASRGHLVVFGGASPEGVDGTAWERSFGFLIGDSWRRLSAAPPARLYAAMAFDATRQVTVLFGGVDGLPGIGVVLGDTWEYDGTTWSQRTPTTAPPARFASAMTYDPTRGVIVMFGGAAADAGYLDDTWEYDGTTWTPRASSARPSPRGHHALAWDSARSVAVTFGGAGDSPCDTWELSSAGWTLASTPIRPACRENTAMAYMPDRQAVVIFGGSLGFFSSPASDTWEYDATGWHQLTGGATTPPGRNGHTLTYDSTADALVLVGGGADSLFDDVWHFAADGTWQKQNPSFGSPGPGVAALVYDAGRQQIAAFHSIRNVWSFDGTRWRALPSATPPPDPRLLPGFAYVPSLGIVMCAGASGSGLSLDDCWAWRDQWSELAITPRPPARVAPAMAYSAKDGALILFGGGDLGSAAGRDDTWELAGGAWRQITGIGHPAAQRGAAMAYDEARERIVMFGRDGTTWAYADHAWSQLSLPHSPPPRAFASFVYDPTRRTLVLLGGAVDERIAIDDAWELDGDDWRPLQLANSPGPRLVTGLAYHAPSHAFVMFGGSTGTATLGDTWLLRYTSNTPDEQCANSIDDDADGRIDAADPDCM